MNNIILSGFNPEHGNIIFNILSKNNLDCRIINENIETKLFKKKDNFFVIMGVYKIDDLKQIRLITTNASNHNYIFGILENNRSLNFTSSFYSQLPLFYLPPEEKELKKIASIIKQKIKNDNSEKSLFNGLKKLNINFEWTTSELKVSKISNFLAELLKKSGYYKTTTEIAHSVLAIEEALVNSIEHGNLELDSSLKQNGVLFNDKYEALKLKRLNDPKYKNRKIKISITIDKGNSSISISDEGKGFNIAKSDVIHNTINKPTFKQIMEHSGKGISLINKAFDDVQYNSKGTEIILINKKK